MKRAFIWFVLVVVLGGVGASFAWRFRPQEEPPSFDYGSVRMEVVNGCGLSYLARSVADELRARGFDVYGVSTASRHYEKTTVVDLLDPAGINARQVAELLVIRRRFWFFFAGEKLMPKVEVALDSACHLEVRLILGEDYGSFFPGVVPLN